MIKKEVFFSEQNKKKQIRIVCPEKFTSCFMELSAFADFLMRQRPTDYLINCNVWTHIPRFIACFAIKILFKFRLRCFSLRSIHIYRYRYIWPRINSNRHDSKSTVCTLIHVRQTHELNHHIYLLHVYCVSLKSIFDSFFWIFFCSFTFYA